MKILIIPDVHGSHEWEEVKKLPASAYDYAVRSFFALEKCIIFVDIPLEKCKI